MHTLRKNDFLIDNARSCCQGIHQHVLALLRSAGFHPILVLNDTFTGAGVQEECKDSQQLKELQKLLPEFISESTYREQICSADSSSQQVIWLGLSPATPQLSQGPAVSTDDGSAPAQPSLPYLSPRFWAALVSCPPWLCVLLSIPLRSSSQPCCHSYVAPGTMWEPRQGDKSWRDSNYFCQINKLIKLPFILQI